MSIAAMPEARVDVVARPAPRPTFRGGPLLLRFVFGGYLTVLVAMPVLAVVWRGLAEGPTAFVEAVTSSTALAAMRLSLGTAAVAAVVQAFIGTSIAWWLVRWQTPGRAFVGALVDLPLAIPTLVAGLVLVTLYGPQAPLGRALGGLGVEIAFARPGILLALLFVTLPFVVRTVEPVLRELDPAEEEAALTLGATPWQTFTRVLLPPLLPAIAAGSLQTFARSIAEFGSVVAVSGNIPFRTLTAPVHVLGEVEGGDPGAAAAVSLVLLAFALGLQPLAGWVARAGVRHG